MDPAQALDALPRLRLCQLPTPIQRLARLEAQLGLSDGPQLYVKRDDLTGAGFGGNKARKLEFSLAEAQLQAADSVITSGGVQSNHCRQTAILATALGLQVHLFLKGERPPRLTGNLLPSELVGATFHFCPPGGTVPFSQQIEGFVAELKTAGRRPYLIPGGASNAIGAMGYVQAVREIIAQERESAAGFDWLFCCATGSHGTQAGLLAGKKLFGLKSRVVGVAVNPVKDAAERAADIARLATATAQRLDAAAAIQPDEVILEAGYVGPGYAIATEGGTEAIRLLARLEGIFLDPCYTGKAMAALLDYARQGRFGRTDRVLFLHTGGNLALFA